MPVCRRAPRGPPRAGAPGLELGRGAPASERAAACRPHCVTQSAAARGWLFLFHRFCSPPGFWSRALNLLPCQASWSLTFRLQLCSDVSIKPSAMGLPPHQLPPFLREARAVRTSAFPPAGEQCGPRARAPIRGQGHREALIPGQGRCGALHRRAGLGCSVEFPLHGAL